MRRFLVRVNGEEYEVEVAEVREEGESHWNIRDIKKVVPSPSPLQVTTTLRAPMPGRVLAINVAKGEKVEAGQVVIILEAMKMENEIVSPIDAVVASIVVKKGDSVNSNDLLVTLS